MKKSIKQLLSAATALTMTAGITFALPAEASTEFIVYDNFANLDFEDQGSFSTWVRDTVHDTSVSGNEKYLFVTDGEDIWAPQHGNSAIYVGGSAPVSIWGGVTNSPGGLTPKDGDLISGTFWIKVMQDKPYSGTRLPKVRLYMKDDSGEAIDLAITKGMDTESEVDEITIDGAEPYTWTQFEIESTGVAYTEGAPLTWEITLNDQVDLPYMIDNVQFGTSREVEEKFDITPYTPYALTKQFDFEDPSLFNEGNLWCHEGVVDFKNNDAEYPAADGSGAVYIDGSLGSFSFWGGGEIWDAPDDSTVIGSFKFKLMQKFYDAEEQEASGSAWFKLPRITFTRGDEVVAYFDPYEVSVLDIGEYTWCEIPIKSTGVKVNTGDIINYTIDKVEGSGIKFMLDDLFIGSPESEQPTPTSAPTDEPSAEPTTEPSDAPIAAAPKVNSYAGYNGDFESISGDLPYNWGMWTSNQDKDGGINAFNIIKDSPLSYSGTAMVEAVRGGTMWSINSDISDKAGQLIGGSFMLYIDEDCNLEKDIPQVTVTYVADGVPETTIASSPKNASEIELVPGWNKLPILPNGTLVPDNATRVNLMIIAPVLEEGNPEYAGGFYIDNIDIGQIVQEIYVNDISSVQVSDDSISCDIVVTNAKTDEDVTADIVAAVYDDEKLIGMSYNDDVTIKGRGSSVVSTELKREIAAAASGALTVSVMIWDKDMRPLTEKTDIYGGSTTYSYNDDNIKYVGRWEDSVSCMSSNWGGAYFKTVFTGTSAALELKGGSDIYVSVDGGEYVQYNPAGAGTLVVAQGLEEGSHTLKVASKYTFDSIRLAGITVDDGAALEQPEMSDIMIEFIGDSNTAGYLLPNNQLDNYSWLTGEALNVEHVHIAYTGMALSDGIYNSNINRDIGMSVLYDKTAPMDERDSADWDSSTYSPDLICINLGANDTNETAVPGGTERFEETLPVFLKHLKEVHPDAQIVVLIPTSSAPGTSLHTIIPAIIDEMADDTINYFDANAWINGNLATNVLSDNVHLSQEGNKVVAENLSEIFAGLLGL